MCSGLPYPANNILTAFVDRLRSVAPDLVDGIYITGSLALDDFHPDKSDIDFVVLCRFLPDEPLTAALAAMHRAIGRLHRQPCLSGAYLTAQHLRTGQAEELNALLWHEGSMWFAPLEMAPVTLFELKTCALTLIGPDAGGLPISIDAATLNSFLYRNINSYWQQWIDRHSKAYGRMLLGLLPRLTEWAILGVARQLCTLETGTIVSKSAAGHYCLTHMQGQFQPIIREALDIRTDHRPNLPGYYTIRPSFERPGQTIACVRAVIRRFNEVYTA